ncbi:hypothetical protein VNO77_23111 [Canavalia gladiata]|uniref:Uncharacterized protein n=1 Tax=Canavalia gladiata TaxID=3824 RepID=A0AAN9QB84_CANGL
MLEGGVERNPLQVRSSQFIMFSVRSSQFSMLYFAEVIKLFFDRGFFQRSISYLFRSSHVQDLDIEALFPVIQWLTSHLPSNEEHRVDELMEESLVKAHRAFRALKGIIRLQALIRGHLVRRQAVITLYCMYEIVKLQALDGKFGEPIGIPTKISKLSINRFICKVPFPSPSPSLFLFSLKNVVHNNIFCMLYHSLQLEED